MPSVLSSFRLHAGLLAVVAATAFTACEKRKNADGTESMAFIGQPKPENRWKAPTEITDFTKLYNLNCRACHSNGDSVTASIALDNPTYLSIVPEAVLRNIVANGIEGTLMPAFGIKAGGSLTDEQIDILVKGILAKKPATVDGTLPAYAAPLGDPANGRALFETSPYAKRDGVAIPLEKSILAPAFLGTVSDQYLRTLLIVGLPSLGYPDFRGFTPGRALTDQEVSDVTAWLVSNRKNEYGQPLVAPSAEPAAPNSSVPPSVP